MKWKLLPFWFPKSRNNQIWAIIFISLTILSIDWWNWNSNNRINNWIPTWVVYLIFIQLVLAYSIWEFTKVFNPVIIERKFESFSVEEQLEETEEKEEEQIKETDDSDKKNITNIYISDSVINRSIIGEKGDKDE